MRIPHPPPPHNILTKSRPRTSPRTSKTTPTRPPLHSFNVDSRRITKGRQPRTPAQQINHTYPIISLTPTPTKVRTEASALLPNLKTFAIPKGLQVERGPDAIVEFLVENLPALLEPESVKKD